VQVVVKVEVYLPIVLAPGSFKLSLKEMPVADSILSPKAAIATSANTSACRIRDMVPEHNTTYKIINSCMLRK
jgi:hypothetical protein